VIGDQPVRIGDFGKFGDLTGTVEDIGMRSTRIRTLARTVVSVPNSSFAGLNIENYSLRDKMLFSAMLGIKRNTPPELVNRLMKALKQKLESHKSVEAEKSMIRVTGLTSSAVNVEVFCYLRASDWDEFYSVQGDLYLIINEVLRSTEVELA
jgi:MscS family membrane protein